jgi:hypothetical protein
MRERTIGVGDIGTTKVGITLADLKLRVAEHIIAQGDSYRPDEVQTILAETKVGAWRRQNLLEKLKTIFSTS